MLSKANLASSTFAFQELMALLDSAFVQTYLSYLYVLLQVNCCIAHIVVCRVSISKSLGEIVINNCMVMKIIYPTIQW